MSANASCASETDLWHLQSFNYRLSAACALSSITATFFVSFSALQMIHKSIFQSSTRIILFFNLLYANLHQVMYAIEALVMVYKGFFLVDEPCVWMQTEEHCVPFSYLLFTGISGMIYSQTGLMIERAFATFYKNYTTSVSRCTGAFVSLIVFICSLVTYRIIIWDDPLDGFTLTCFSAPVHSAIRANRFLSLCVILTVFNLISSMIVMHYNKRLEYEIRYKVKERFQKRETIDSTHTICLLSMSQFLMMFMYSLGALLLRTYKVQITYVMFKTLIVWIYTLPYSALLLPLILISRIRATKVCRTQKISDITSTRQTQDEHIDEINRMWS